MNIGLWISQVVLAVVFGIAGIKKIISPIPELASQLGWPGDIPEILVRVIGFSEFAAAVGLLVPSLLKIKPKLTVWAALGLATIMTLALIFHISRGEMFAIPINLGFGLLSAFVAWGRHFVIVITK